MNKTERKYRRKKLTRRTVLTIFAAIIAVATLAPLTATAVQNIFFLSSLGQVVDIQMNGNFIDQVQFQGEIIWERIPDYDGANISSIDPATCNTSAPIGQIYTVRDSRGAGQNYRIRCMEDGRYWMITNLKRGSRAGPLTLTPADTNIRTNWTMPQVNAGGAPSGGNTVHTGFDQPIADALLIGDSLYDASLPSSSETDPSSPNFAGYFYNWCMSTAGGASSGGIDTCTPSNTMPTGDATTDICPAGWRLPVGGGTVSTNDFAILNASMQNGKPSAGNDSLAYFANWIWSGNKFYGVYSGLRQPGSWSGQGLIGTLWSSSRGSSTAQASYSVFDSTQVIPDYSRYRNFQNTLRCLLPP